MKQQNRIETAALDVRNQIEHRLKRIEAELRYARFLAERVPKGSEDMASLVARAESQAVEGIESGSLERLDKAIDEAERTLSPLADEAKKRTLYCVGHAHIDMNWMWSWPETVSVTIDTFTTVLELLEQFPGFVFSQSQASVYSIIEEYRPDMLEPIKQRVREKRWEVTASHWVETDKNIAGGESLTRHLLYTRRYMKELFDLTPEDVQLDWAPDTFGHAHTVPSYLVRGGVRYVYLHRPGVHGGFERPEAFRWRGPDGSEVLVRNDMILAYNGVIGDDIADRCLIPFERKTGLPFAMFVYGVGDHGGGPTRRDLLRITEMAGWPIFPEIRFSRASEFYARLDEHRDALPVIDDELNYEFTGCYTTQSLIKKANRFGERNLESLEAAAVAAGLTVGLDYPVDSIVRGWRNTLFNHFHDILPGSGVRDTRTYTHGLFQKTSAMTNAEETRALRAIASSVDTAKLVEAAGIGDIDAERTISPHRHPISRGGGVGMGAVDGALSAYGVADGNEGRVFLLYNPTQKDRKEIVVATIWDSCADGREAVGEGNGASDDSHGFEYYTSSGDHGAAQIVERGSYWGHRYIKVAIPAGVRGFEYAVCAVVETGSDTGNGGRPTPDRALAPGGASTPRENRHIGFHHPCSYATYERGPEGIENGLVRFELDMNYGGIARLIDQRSKTVIVEGGADGQPLFEYFTERPHPMSAWVIEHGGDVERPVVKSVIRKGAGPYVVSLEVDFEIKSSRFTVVYCLYADDPALHISIRGSWFERGTPETGIPVLRMVVPTRLEDPHTEYEIPFGSKIRRTEHGEEVPALRWAMIHGKSGDDSSGLLVVNDSKHGHSFCDHTLSVTLIRSSYDPDPFPEIGEHEMRFTLTPYSGEMSAVDAAIKGAVAERAIRVVSTGIHEGALPAEAQWMRIRSDGAVVSGLKRCEEGEGIIVRLYNPEAESTEVNVSFDESLGAMIRDAVFVDLIEREIGGEVGEHPDVIENGVGFTVPSRGITSVRIDVTIQDVPMRRR